MRLSDATGLGIDELFPPELYQNAVFGLRPVVEVESEQFLSLRNPSVRQLPAPVDEPQWETRDAINAVLMTLMPREEKIVRARYGLDDGVDRTLEDIAQDYGLSRDRIHQIEQKALRKLRHPRAVRLLGTRFGVIPKWVGQ